MSIIGDGIMLGAGGETASIFVTGLSETDTVTASKDGKTIVGKWTQKSNPAYVVPDGYTQLEYIESTGTQCFDTGIKASSNVGVEIDYFDFTTNGTNENILFGGSNGSWDAQLGMNNQLGYGKTYAYYGYDGNTGLPIETACKYKLENGVLYKNGEQVYSNAFSAFSYNYNIYLLAQNWAGTIRNHIKLKLKSFKMWESKALVRDFIPAKRKTDSTVGLYDIVNDVFYTNAGTGTFVVGPEIPQTIDGFLIDKIKDYGTWTVTATDGTNTATQDVLVDTANTFQVEIGYSRLPAGYTEVEFIRSSGQQYLELDYLANTKSVLEIDFIINSVSYISGWCQLLGSESNGNFSCWLKNTPGFNFYTVGGNYLHSVSFVGNKYKLIFGNGSIVLNGSTIYTYTASSFTASASVVINGIRGYLNGEYPYPSMTIYPFNFKEDDVVVAEYIPCVRDSDNSVGVFNIVSETFIGNSGSGSFIAGDSV